MVTRACWLDIFIVYSAALRFSSFHLCMYFFPSSFFAPVPIDIGCSNELSPRSSANE